MALIGLTTAALTRPLRTGAMSQYPYTPDIAARFQFVSRFEEEVDGAIRDGNTLWVPREAVPYALPPEDYRVSYPGLPAINCSIHWRPEQEDKCHQSLALLKDGQNHIFEAPTGWGKTVAGSWIANELGQPTLIVVTKEDLMLQWKNTLTKVIGVPSSLIGHIQGDVEDWQGKRFVLGMVQSLMIEGKYEMPLFKYFGLTLFDECHQMAAECFVRVCQSFYAKYRLGFSATPDRKDGKTKLLQWHIGPTKVRGKVLSLTPRVIVRPTKWSIPKEIYYKPGRMMGVFKAMANSAPRNMEIVNFVTQTYHAKRTTLIMSDLRDEHLNKLFLLLTQKGISGENIAYYVGGMKPHELALAKTKPIVLATYKMCSTGTDVPSWDTLVLATPRSDIRQSAGRILRLLEGKLKPVIFDLVDKDSIFQNFYQSRLKQYYQLGAEVKLVA